MNMKITLEPSLNAKNPDTTAPKIIIELPFDDLDLPQVMDYLIKPALIGYGFNGDLIESYFDAE
jgi:hypothetical protein